MLILWHLKKDKPLFPIPKKTYMLIQIVEEEGLKHSFWMSDIFKQTVLLPEQDMKQKDTGEQDVIKSQDWWYNKKNSYMKRGWRFRSGKDNICNMQMISWVSKGVANLPLDL